MVIERGHGFHDLWGHILPRRAVAHDETDSCQRSAPLSLVAQELRPHLHRLVVVACASRAQHCHDAIMTLTTRRPGIGSALLRVPLQILAVLVLTVVPENLSSWSEPNASVLPSERTMPVWGNYVLAATLLAALVAITLGWIIRRQQPPRPGPVWHISSWVAMLGLLWWAGVLIASHVISAVDGARDEAVIGVGPDIFLDLAFALVALITLAVIARDMVLIRRAKSSAHAHSHVASD